MAINLELLFGDTWLRLTESQRVLKLQEGQIGHAISTCYLLIFFKFDVFVQYMINRVKISIERGWFGHFNL